MAHQRVRTVGDDPMAPLRLNPHRCRRVGVGPEGDERDVKTQRDGDRTEDLQPNRHVREAIAHRIERHHLQPRDRQRKKDRHQRLVGARLSGAEQALHALRKQRRVASREPSADEDRREGHFAQEHPRARPVDRAGRHEHERSHDGDEREGLDGQPREHETSSASS
jgi:hypothetical protein